MGRMLLGATAGTVAVLLWGAWMPGDEPADPPGTAEQTAPDAGTSAPDDAAPDDAAPDDAAPDDAAPATDAVVVETAPHHDVRKSSSEPSVELGAFAGGQSFYGSTRPRPRWNSGVSFGLRAGYRVTRWLMVDGEVGFTPSKADHEDVLMIAWRMHGVMYVPPAGLGHRELHPYFVAGLGGMTSSYSSVTHAGQELQIPLTDSDHDLVVDAGLGASFMPFERLGFRLEARAIVTPVGSRDAFDTPDLEVLLGVFGRFGPSISR